MRSLITAVAGIVLIAACADALGQIPATADNVPAGLRNARATMKTFLTAKDNLAQAAECLDFSALAEPPDQAEREQYAGRLKDVIDRLAWVDYSKISDDPAGEPFHFPADQPNPPITIRRGADGAWQFDAKTVASIPELYQRYKDQPLLVSHTPWYREMTPIGNEVWRIFALFLSVLIALIAGKVIRSVLSASATSLERRVRLTPAVALRALSRSIMPLLLAVGLEVGLHMLVLNQVVAGVAGTVISVFFTTAIAYIAYCLVDVVDHWLSAMAARTSSKLDDMLVPMVRSSLRVTVVVLLLVQIATVLSDKPVTSIIAGLSVGGLAIGLAAQDTVKNFFGSMMIFSDRPFELGDRIVVDGFDGSVELVGFRSTRLRTLDGHLVTIPNGELANSKIENIGKRPYLRRKMDVTVTYDTTPDKVQEAVDILLDVLKDHEGMDPDRPPRVFFSDFGDVALGITVFYWYCPPDYWQFCEINQRVNFEVLRRFNGAGIEFAFPTQTLYLAGDPNRPLSVGTHSDNGGAASANEAGGSAD